MDYLVYVSYDAENLQFYLWLQDYTLRFYAASSSEQALSPPWFSAEAPSCATAPEQRPRTADKSKVNVTVYEAPTEKLEPLGSPSLSPQYDQQSFISGGANTDRTVTDSVEEANAQMGLKWQSCRSFCFSSYSKFRADLTIHQSPSSRSDLKSTAS